MCADGTWKNQPRVIETKQGQPEIQLRESRLALGRDNRMEPPIALHRTENSGAPELLQDVLVTDMVPRSSYSSNGPDLWADLSASGGRGGGRRTKVKPAP